MDKRARQAIVHRVEKSWTRLKRLSMHAHIWNWHEGGGVCSHPSSSLCGKTMSSLAAAKSLQSCPTLCDPIDGSSPGSSVPGILQARILEWVAISFSNACMHANSLQSCLTLCDPMNSSPPGSSVHRILQARILECGAISFSLSMLLLLLSRSSHVRLCATPSMAAHQAPPSLGFSRQEHLETWL